MNNNELEQLLMDVCVKTVLNYTQAKELWKVIGNKRKMWQASEDACSYGYDEIYKRASIGYYQEDYKPEPAKIISSIPDKNIIEMTKMILAQNERILKMNESLLAVLSSPVIINRQ